METFSRTELEWIRMAVDANISTLHEIIHSDPEFADQPIVRALAQLRMEGLTIVYEKLGRIIDSDAKRIAIGS